MANPLRKAVVGLFTGITFEFRKVRLKEYMAILRDLPMSVLPSTMNELRDLKLVTENLSKLSKEQIEELDHKTAEFYLVKGLTRLKYPGEEWRNPNIWYGREELCPDGMICMADLGNDLDQIIQEIAAYSFHLGGEPELVGFFRERMGGADAGSGGEPIQGQAVGSPSEGNGAGGAEALVRRERSIKDAGDGG
jgi:hypothetical protein